MWAGDTDTTRQRVGEETVNQLLIEDAARERYSAMLRDSDQERQAAQQLQIRRAWRRVERAKSRLERALEEAYALPARPNPVTEGEPEGSGYTADREYDKQFAA